MNIFCVTWTLLKWTLLFKSKLCEGGQIQHIKKMAVTFIYGIPLIFIAPKLPKVSCYKKQDIIFNCFRMSLCKLQIRMGLFLIEKFLSLAYLSLKNFFKNVAYIGRETLRIKSESIILILKLQKYLNTLEFANLWYASSI